VSAVAEEMIYGAAWAAPGKAGRRADSGEADRAGAAVESVLRREPSAGERLGQGLGGRPEQRGSDGSAASRPVTAAQARARALAAIEAAEAAAAARKSARDASVSAGPARRAELRALMRTQARDLLACIRR